MTKLAIVFGASGATGSKVCSQLLDDANFDKVIAYTREKLRTPQNKNPKLLNKTDDLMSLESFENIMDPTKTFIFCCLGTTRKKSRSAEAFRRVDFDLCLRLAKIARKQNIGYFSIITAQGANSKLWAPKNSLFHPLFYSKIKGEIELELIKLNFSCLHIYRPGLLDRKQKDKRFFEDLAIKILPSLPVDKLASFMIGKSLSYQKGHDKKKFTIFEDKDIYPR
ncbi:MAG: hypothetical protein CMP11_07430 [Zetaproteobacteria bacterium]|nr:hypothetical protein [Pseudobdellovibrionaceae bacterium]